MTMNKTLVTPTSESGSLILHARPTCNYRKCSYCPNFGDEKRERFNMREFEDFLTEEAQYFVTEAIDSIFLSEGNTLGMESRQILDIIAALKNHFPLLTSVSAYGNARSVHQRPLRELEQLKQQGLTRLHMGFESGNDDVLTILNKGVTRDEIAQAALKVIDAGIELHLYLLIGSGGKALSERHIEDSVELLNSIKPDTVECHTLVLVPRTPLHNLYESGGFIPLTPHETLGEIKAVVGGITVPLNINCSHISNYCHVGGSLPQDRRRMENELEYCLTLDESIFKANSIVNISVPG